MAFLTLLADLLSVSREPVKAELSLFVMDSLASPTQHTSLSQRSWLPRSAVARQRTTYVAASLPYMHGPPVHIRCRMPIIRRYSFEAEDAVQAQWLHQQIAAQLSHREATASDVVAQENGVIRKVRNTAWKSHVAALARRRQQQGEFVE